MQRGVKIFIADSKEELEKQVNDFLNDESDGAFTLWSVKIEPTNGEWSEFFGGEKGMMAIIDYERYVPLSEMLPVNLRQKMDEAIFKPKTRQVKK